MEWGHGQLASRDGLMSPTSTISWLCANSWPDCSEAQRPQWLMTAWSITAITPMPSIATSTHARRAVRSVMSSPDPPGNRERLLLAVGTETYQHGADFPDG